jgi:hypothetical protein
MNLFINRTTAILALKISQRTTKDADILARLDEQQNLIEPRLHFSRRKQRIHQS